MVVKRVGKSLFVILLLLLLASTAMFFVEPVAPDDPPGNTPPIVTGENPVNNSVDINTPSLLNVTVDDVEDDFLNVTWYSNSSGQWAVFAQDLNISTSNGTVNICQVNHNFTNYSTLYYWSVNVTDGTTWTNRTYCFTTMKSGMGWRLLANGTVLDMWNRINHYYFNVSNGVQFTNHYNRYWAHNVMMIGYLTGGTVTDPDNWNLIYRVDELSGFTRQLRTDGQTYINVTLWKDLSYGSYDFRLAIRYHLGVDDADLSVIPYVKNLGIPIPFVTAFGWELKDINIDNTEHNSSIYINQTRYLLNQTPLDEKYTNLTRVVMLWNETSQQNENVTIPDPRYTLYRAGHQHQNLYLKWNSTLKYLVWVKNRTKQYNAPVTLFLRIGKLNIDQERYTTMHWLDSTLNLIPDGDGTVQQWDWTPGGFPPRPAWQCVDDPVGMPDEDTTYIYTNVIPEVEDFQHVTSPLLTGAIITNVRVTARAKFVVLGMFPSAIINTGLKIGVTRYSAGASAMITGAYDDYTWDWPNNPAPPGNPWTKADIDNLQSSLLSVDMRDATIRCTQIYLTVTYTRPPPEIVIDFAGNLGDSGGPFWRPPSETVQLVGQWSDGYYANDSPQSEDWMYIYCTISSVVGLDATTLFVNWLNETTWTNSTYRLQFDLGNSYYFNTSLDIQVACGFNYSFNIVATDTDGQSNHTWWNKTGLGGGFTRRWVQLECSPVNISYSPFYYYNAVYGDSDRNKEDRLHHDQGADSTEHDSGYLLSTIPDDAVQFRWCTGFIGRWFDESVCMSPSTATSIYYHLWWSSDDGALDDIGWQKNRSYTSSVLTDSYSTDSSNNRSSIYCDNGQVTVSNTYYLDTNLLTITPTSFTDNDIYEFCVKVMSSGVHPSTVSNRSFTSFILLDVPSNATLNASYLDSDNDILSDWEELYTTYTNPFLADTDNDGIDDCDECKSGSDPNNYTDTKANIAPTITGEIPANQSVDINATPTLNVTVDDKNDNTLDAYWLSNSSSSWVEFAYNLSIDTGSGGVNISQANSNFSAESKTYWWCVNVTDGCLWTNETYYFTTEAAAPTIIFDINRTSFAFGLVQNDTMIFSNETQPDTFNIFNNGSCSIDIDINGTNATSSGVADWVLSPNNGDNLYKMEVYNSTTNWWQINLTADTWYDNMAQSTNITANIRMTTPILFYSGKQMTCTIYMTASIH